MLRELIVVEHVASTGEVPFHLLLLADENLAAIHKYFFTSDVYVAKVKSSQELIGVFVLQQIGHNEMEIKNIAVHESHQGVGIGSYLIAQITQLAVAKGIHTLWVGTPANDTGLIHFYQKNGFRVAGMRKNFFPENYPDPIYENGILLTDMVMLQIILTPFNNATKTDLNHTWG